MTGDGTPSDPNVPEAIKSIYQSMLEKEREKGRREAVAKAAEIFERWYGLLHQPRGRVECLRQILAIADGPYGDGDE